MTTKEASKFFLTSICSLDTSIRVIGNLAIAAGSWQQVDPKVSQSYIADAATGARTAAATLTNPAKPWPTNLNSWVQGTSRDILALIVPLQQMAQASNGADMAKPWSAIANQPRSDEQELRLQLQLPPAGAVHDGCPAPPPVIVSKPTSSRTPSAQPPTINVPNISNGQADAAKVAGQWTGNMVNTTGQDVLYVSMLISPTGANTVDAEIVWTTPNLMAQGREAKYLAHGSVDGSTVHLDGYKWVERDANHYWTMDSFSMLRTGNQLEGTYTGAAADSRVGDEGRISLTRGS